MPDLNDAYICPACVSDEDLQQFVRDRAEAKKCTFCKAKARKAIAAPAQDIIDHIVECITKHYEDPANSMAYESAEGGYQGTTYYSDELLDEVGLEFPNDTDDVLRDAVLESLPNDLWCDMDYYSLRPEEILLYSWDNFCNVIKFQRRYFFADPPKERDREIHEPSEVLRLIFQYAGEVGAFRTMPKGTRLFRARYQPKGKSFATAGSLGPPPQEHSIQTNRMSPPGIVMMYAADDLRTALAETAAAVGTYAVGEFLTTRDAVILDLSNLPAAPSIFAEVPDHLEYDPRPRLIFLDRIGREISQPIARDDRIHISYVPTQVITEYVRTNVNFRGRAIDGMRYRSSRKSAGTAVVLFADQRSLVLPKDEQPELYALYDDRWLALDKASKRIVRKQDIERWKP